MALLDLTRIISKSTWIPDKKTFEIQTIEEVIGQIYGYTTNINFLTPHQKKFLLLDEIKPNNDDLIPLKVYISGINKPVENNEQTLLGLFEWNESKYKLPNDQSRYKSRRLKQISNLKLVKNNFYSKLTDEYYTFQLQDDSLVKYRIIDV